MTTYKGRKFKVETSSKERDQRLVEFITIDILKLEHQNLSSEDNINIPMNPTINSSFNKHPVSWEIIHCRLLHSYDSVMKAMCCPQTQDGLPKNCPKKIHKVPFTICYTQKMTNINKVKIVETSNLQSL